MCNIKIAFLYVYKFFSFLLIAKVRRKFFKNSGLKLPA